MNQPGNPLEVLQRIRRSVPEPDPEERCELCRAVIAAEHSHVVDLEGRGLLCACRPCWFLFTSGGAGGGRYRAVPERYLAVAGFMMSPAQWDALQIPVNVAFFFENSVTNQVAAFYPSPAGATESLLALEAWAEVVAANPLLDTLALDVEAVLVRYAGATPECYIVPIDACYELVGRLRQGWRGFDGGKEGHEQLHAFFARIRASARPIAAGARDG